MYKNSLTSQSTPFLSKKKTTKNKTKNKKKKQTNNPTLKWISLKLQDAHTHETYDRAHWNKMITVTNIFILACACPVRDGLDMHENHGKRN